MGVSCFEKNKTTEQKLTERSRPPGRPRKMWINIVKVNTHVIGLVMEDANGREKLQKWTCGLPG